MSQISRTQAYARLVIAVVDLSLPAPQRIAMDSDGPLVEFDSVEAFEAWRDALGAPVREPSASTGWTSYSSSTVWQDMDIVLSAMVKRPQAEPVTEDLTSVRAAAGAVSE